MTLKMEKSWDELTSQESIDKARQEGDRLTGELLSSDVDALRWRAKHDLFFLVTSILGYKDLSINLHGHLCKWLTETEDDRFRLTLLPRSHFKTTVVTIGDSIRISLPSDDENDIYPYNLGTDVRILLAHESAFGSSRFLYEITNHFCNNPLLMALFPECVPSRLKQRMNSAELELPRVQHWAEPTFDTIGVGGRSQGRHYNVIKADDLFGDKARDSEADRRTTIQWVDNLQAFFVNLPKDHLDFVGTRYSLDDLYAHIITVYEKQLIKYIRRVEEPTGNKVIKDGKTVEEVAPIFPERFTTSSLDILRKNKVVFAAQYANDPLAGLGSFDSNWKRFYNWLTKTKIQVFTGTRSEIIDIKDLDIIILSDPAVSGKGGTLVTGTDAKMKVYVLEAIKHQIGPEQYVNLLFQLVQKWWPRTVAIEEILFMALFEPWLKREQQIRGIRFHFTPLKPKKVVRVGGANVDESKRDRVKGLAPYFSAGQIFFHNSQYDLIDEFNHFGATDDYHLLDALAYGPFLWHPAITSVAKELLRKQEVERLDERDIATGYSK